MFAAKGSVTAGNSSQTSDGAGCLILASEKAVKQFNLQPLARFVSFASRGVPPTVVATAQLTASTVVMIPVVLVTVGTTGLFSASAPVWAAVFGLALLSTAVAYILYFNLVASAGATNASLVTLVVPASAILLGIAFLGESLEAYEMAGIALIALGLVTIDGRLLRRQ